LLNKLFGIINGIDCEVWNPATDKHIYYNYSIKNAITGKKENKKALFKDTGLKGTCKPLFGIVSRLAKQKGFDVFLEDLSNWYVRRNRRRFSNNLYLSEPI
jgi:starch synthase